ncbi:MAG: hypothetical protein Q8P33_03685 [bacterium]|nr:hypothetical protein [bacterium]
MTLKTYQVLFWVMLSLIILVMSYYAYLYSRGLVTFTAGSGSSSQVEPLQVDPIIDQFGD